MKNENKKFELSISAYEDYNGARSDIESIVNQLNFEGHEEYDGNIAMIYVSSKQEALKLKKEANKLIDESDAKVWNINCSTDEALIFAQAIENIFDEDGDIIDCINL
jgi:hypothetical protein